MCAETTTPDYKDSVFLPTTNFPMRANLPTREPEWLKRWEAMDLYATQRAQSAGRPTWTLHDGPPYANGHLHIGHALNKILKDFVVRSHQALGFDSRYVPGWDCHGLPIEWKIEEQYRAQGKNKDSVPINELRAECRRFAEGWIDIQREEFKRLGINGAWDKPYTTMAFAAEAAIAREFMKFVMNGALYRGSKPVMWSPVEKTALAEAEVEYHEHESHTIWVKFRAVTAPTGALSGADVVIWTTTPWTIPSNRGVAFNPSISYGLYQVTDAPADNWAVAGDKLVLADALAEATLTKARVADWVRVCDVGAADLTGAILAHPLRAIAGAGGFWDYEVPLLAGDFVTEDAGTGFVHCAPSHGADDYELFRQNGLLDRITHNVLEDSSFAPHVPLFAGLAVMDAKGKEGKANKAVIDALIAAGRLLARGKIKHSYPHSWRSKAPLIFRNTPQWFIALDKPLHAPGQPIHGRTIRQMALESIDRDVQWTPPSGRNRIYAMIANRPDWVVSRQRAWGVPLTCFMRTRIEGGVEVVELLRDERVNARIEAAFEAEGADAWFKPGAAARFLDGLYDPAEWTKVDDILDVWFDSGSTHAFVMEGRADGTWPASMYLEGTDQHRGWFHSSLLEACGTRGRAPYSGVLTHGFCLDEKGQKMSKSLGNVVAPQEVIKEYGADILRLWVAQSDYTEDLRIGKEIMKGVADTYRRLRNSFRFLLGALAGFDEAERVDPEQMPELERWVLHRLAELDVQLREGYRKYDYPKLFAAVFNFCTSDLSAFYFDVRKDALYCDAASSLRRRACRTVLDLVYHRLVTWLSPILVFTCEEVWLERHAEGSVHLQTIPETPSAWLNPALAERMAQARNIRRVVDAAIERRRMAKEIGSSLEAAPRIWVSTDFAAVAKVDFAEICITSAASLTIGAAPQGAFTLDDVKGVAVIAELAVGEKCARCWQVLPDVGSHAKAPGCCARCAEVVG